MKRFLVLALTISCFLCGCKNEVTYDMDAQLPVDPSYRIGKLDNGLTYYIKNNNEPEDLANFYIIQKVGALLEEDHQNGLAHFLEHMAFNGTTNFPGKRIIKMLESHGVAFGQDINAFTALDKTVYNLSRIPVDNELLIDSCLLVLSDWSHNLTLAEEEINAERGVIVEEWRQRNNLSARISSKTMPVLMEGSKYAVRDVIGDMDVVRNFEPEALMAYYKKWYRPDLQAIAIVGAIDVDQIEAKVKELFSKIPKVENPTPLPEFPLKPRKDIGYVCATDRDATGSSVQIYSINKKEDKDGVTHNDIKDAYIQSFYNQMLGARMAEMIRKGSDSVDGGSATYGQFIKGYTSYSVSVTAKPNMEAQALESVYSEVERSRRYGFSPSELERVKTATLTSLDNAYKKKDKVNSESYAKEIYSMFLDGEQAVSMDYYYEFAKDIIDQITIEDLNAVSRQFVTKNNQVIIVTGPDKGVKHSTKEELLAAMDKVEKSVLEPYHDDVAGLNLISEDVELEGSDVDKVEDIDMFDAEKWTLDNGIEVIYAFANHDANSVYLIANSDGGTSLLEKEDLLTASVTGGIMGSFGIGDFDPTMLSKYMAGRTAGVKVGISELGESVSGTSSTKDFETLPQLVYLTFEKPRFDELQFKNIISRSATRYDMFKGTPEQVMQDTMRVLFSNNHPRSFGVEGDDLRDIKLENIEKIYRNRISNGADFKFYIVGDISKQKAKSMVQKYLGSISTNETREKWVDHNQTIAEGIAEKQIEVNFQTPTASIISYTKSTYDEYSRKLSYEAEVLKGILDQRFVTNIREKESGTYGVSMGISVSKEPRQVIGVTIQFKCDPEKHSHLLSLVHKELATLMESGVTDEEIKSVTKNLLKEVDTGKNKNAFVLASLMNWEDDKIDTSDPEVTKSVINSITKEDVKRLANEVFKADNDRLDITFVSPDSK